MTTQALSTRDERAETAIETSIRDRLFSPAPKEITVSAQDNYSGEPALYVYVEMPSSQDIPDEALQNILVVRMLAALEEIGDARFPYLFFGPRDLPAGKDAGLLDDEET